MPRPPSTLIQQTFKDIGSSVAPLTFRLTFSGSCLLLFCCVSLKCARSSLRDLCMGRFQRRFWMSVGTNRPPNEPSLEESFLRINSLFSSLLLLLLLMKKNRRRHSLKGRMSNKNIIYSTRALVKALPLSWLHHLGGWTTCRSSSSPDQCSAVLVV